MVPSWAASTSPREAAAPKDHPGIAEDDVTCGDVVLSREELLSFQGGPEALERWHAQDDSTYERLFEQQLREDREADARMVATRRPSLRAL